VTAGHSAVDRARHGDRDAWRALVGQHLGLIHAICRGHGLSPAAAADVNLVVWLQLVEHLSRIRSPEAIGGWIAATTRSQCLGPRRAADRSGYAAADIAFGQPSTTNGNGRANGNGQANGNGSAQRNGNGHHPPSVRGQDVAAAFARIGAHCQRLLRLAVTVPRPSAEDISAALDLPAGEVDPACRRCLDRLRRLVAAEPDAVVAELERLVAGSEPVPSDWWAAAEVAFAWLGVDAAAATRVYDSVTVDGMQEVRHVRFSVAGAGAGKARHEGVELVVDSNGDEALLAGRLMSGRSEPVTAWWPTGERTVIADETGGFRFHDLPVAPLCVVVAGAEPLKTGWVLP
jgi:DNA-directed RNA polymerase specialized sigma24 family protein